MVSGVNCTKCKYGTLLPLHPLDYDSAWECSDCDNIVQNELIATKLNKYEEDIENMEKNKVGGYNAMQTLDTLTESDADRMRRSLIESLWVSDLVDW